MNTIAKKPEETSSKAILLCLFEEQNGLSEIQEILNNKFSGVISNNILKNFKGKLNETFILPLDNGTTIGAIGLGKKQDFNMDNLRNATSKGISSISKFIKEGVLSIELANVENFCKKSLAEASAIATGMTNYKFDKYKTKKPENIITTLEILTDETDLIQEATKKADIINESMNFTKNLIFESAEIMTPEKVCEIASELAQKENLEIKVYDKNQLKEMNFNAFLAVGQGSTREPKFFHITYKHPNAKKKVALIGKGITFDSGGLDIKPPSSMLTMKTDMSGCATVLGVMNAISKLQPEIELHVMSALCENMPSGSSYKVGDVLISKSGKTIEVDNTDAEGRLTLADVLTYADEINPDEVIDIATLTGAVIVALGGHITGILGNNQEQINEFMETASKTGEKVWQLPIFDDLMDNLKSDIADMSNTGGRQAGTSTAARFLQNFTKSKKWLHLDIAGTAFIDKPYRELQKGATGVMLRSIVNYLIK